jgi:hypothetical protein
VSRSFPDPFERELDSPIPAIDPKRLRSGVARPQLRAQRLVALVLVVAWEALLLSIFGVRPDLADVPSSYLLLAAGAPVLAGASACWIGVERRRPWAATALVLVAFAAAQIAASAIDWPTRFEAWRWMRCPGLISLFASAPLLVVVFVFRHAFTTRGVAHTAVLAAVTAVFAASALRLHCPNDLLLHVLLSHGIPVLGATALTAALARRVTRA